MGRGLANRNQIHGIDGFSPTYILSPDDTSSKVLTQLLCCPLWAELPSIDGLWSRPWSFGKLEQAFMLQLWVPFRRIHAVVIFATFRAGGGGDSGDKSDVLQVNGLMELRWRTVLDEGYLATST